MSDRHRPQYHFLPPANWMNDPNGLIQWQGTYHLFYQCNPNAPHWDTMHWGHASSPDLVHWQHLPVALAPTPGGPDQSGVWSGCAVDWDGKPALIYTGREGELETICLASDGSDFMKWEKYPDNPLNAAPPPDLDLLGFRDPYVWKDAGVWLMAIGSGIRDVGGAVLLYSSANLTDWTYLGPLIIGDAKPREPVWTGEMWECPNFFSLGDRQLLLISAMDQHPPRSLYTLYFLGTFADYHFTAEAYTRMDGGDVYFYAPQSFLDESGRRIVLGWAREARSPEAVEAAGWAGVLTLPRVLEWRPDGWISQRPLPELETLRGEELTWEDLRVEPEGIDQGLVDLPGLSGDTLELAVDFALDEPAGDQEGSFGLVVRRSPGGEEQTEIRCDRMGEKLVVNTLHSSLDPNTEPGNYVLPLDLSGLDHLHLRVFLDRSIIEVYANDLAVITARVYPTREDSRGVALFARRQPVRLQRLRAWPMRSIWE